MFREGLGGLGIRGFRSVGVWGFHGLGVWGLKVLLKKCLKKQKIFLKNIKKTKKPTKSLCKAYVNHM